ncbi:MAG: hypothetical protein VX740_06625 [Pseudomonadota bacterium]|jgi:hypothetical protein|nr:hypothetical protein [Pseudomonadota bacterium]MEC7702471.1 hypothetical protein [Pseudomonadota bacterium]MED5423097.1 hypothetical protein [Pseudomonadota bacterium]
MSRMLGQNTLDWFEAIEYICDEYRDKEEKGIDESFLLDNGQ